MLFRALYIGSTYCNIRIRTSDVEYNPLADRRRYRIVSYAEVVAHVCPACRAKRKAALGQLCSVDCDRLCRDCWCNNRSNITTGNS